MEATVDVWHRESEMAKGKKSSLSESVALNDLKWQQKTREVCNSGGAVTGAWLTVPKTSTFTALLPRTSLFWGVIDAYFCIIMVFDINVCLDRRAYTSLGVLFSNFYLL